jgi:hypothetical protein
MRGLTAALLTLLGTALALPVIRSGQDDVQLIRRANADKPKPLTRPLPPPGRVVSRNGSPLPSRPDSPHPRHRRVFDPKRYPIESVTPDNLDQIEKDFLDAFGSGRAPSIPYPPPERLGTTGSDNGPVVARYSHPNRRIVGPSSEPVEQPSSSVNIERFVRQRQDLRNPKSGFGSILQLVFGMFPRGAPRPPRFSPEDHEKVTQSLKAAKEYNMRQVAAQRAREPHPPSAPHPVVNRPNPHVSAKGGVKPFPVVPRPK